MTITQLEYLIAVDEHKSFALAAKKLEVTQPTLSMQIRKVEDDLNAIVFDRSRKPVITTEIGRKIIDQAKIGLMELNKIRDIIIEQKDVMKGDLRIGILPSLTNFLLPILIENLIEKFPDVNLSVEELLQESIYQKLNTNQIDVGIMPQAKQDNSLVHTPLFRENFVLYASKGNPVLSKKHLLASDINSNELWLLKETLFLQRNNFGFDQHAKSRLSFDSGNIETVKKIVDQKGGYTLLPELSLGALSDEEKKRTKHFDEPQPFREIALITSRRLTKHNLIELLKNEIVTNVHNQKK